jgi:pre-mRNA-processing factor SLU7
MRGNKITYHRSGAWLSRPKGIYRNKQAKVMKRLGFLKKKKKDIESDEEVEEIVYKYREGACENCGAMTHTKKFCIERPRKVGVKYMGKNFGKNEKMKKSRSGFEAKRDNWEYYNPENHTELLREYELKEEIKKDLNLDKGENEYKERPDDNTHYLDKDDDTRETNYHSLRQREDIASYLKKNEGQDKVMEKKAGKYTGDSLKLLKQERAIWEQIEVHGQEVFNSVATPTATELMFRKKQERKEQKEQKRNEELVSRYGQDSTTLGKRSSVQFEGKNRGKLMREDKDLLVIKEEDEIRHQMKKETESLVVKETKRGGHKNVWGSWWNKELGWGYKCCYGTNRYERCLGQNARALAVLKEYKLKNKLVSS